jgi:hypothetical protein
MLPTGGIAAVIPQGAIAKKYGIVAAIAFGIMIFVVIVVLGSPNRRVRVHEHVTLPAARQAEQARTVDPNAPRPLLVPTPVSGELDWSMCRVAPPLVSGEEPLLVYTSVFVGQNCISVGSKEVIPATHFTADRIPALFRLVRLWTTPRRGRLRHSGCISASFGASDPSQLAELRIALEDSPGLSAFLLIHVVIGPQTPYPFNVHRNAALEPWNSAWLDREPLAWVKKAEGVTGKGKRSAAAGSGKAGSSATAGRGEEELGGGGEEDLGGSEPTPAYFAAAQVRGVMNSLRPILSLLIRFIGAP